MCGVRGEILRAEDIADWTPSEPAEEATASGQKRRRRRRSRRRDGDESGGDEEDEGEGEDEDESQVSERTRKRRNLEKEDIARLNLLVPNVELATGCSPNNLPGGPPSAQAQVLAQRLLSLLHTADIIPLSRLRVWNDLPTHATSSSSSIDLRANAEAEGEGLGKKEVKAYWVLYIDIMFLSLSGPPFDSAWLAMLAALRDTRLPPAVWDADRGGVVCTPDPGVTEGLMLRDLPAALTFGVFVEEGGSAIGRKERRKWILADVDGFEEGLCREMITVVVGREGRLLRIEKVGGERVGAEEVRGVVEAAERWRKQCVQLLKS